jgi:integrase
MTLTKRLIDTTAPAARDVVLYDDDVRGLHLKVTPGGKRSFFFFYRTRSGRQRRPKIGEYGVLTLEQARTIARRWALTVAEGGDPSADRQAARAAPTMQDLHDRYVREVQPTKRPSSQRNDTTHWRRYIMPWFAHRKVADITESDVQALHTELGQTKKGTANMVRALLSHAFTMAIKWKWREKQTNPCWDVQPHYIPKRKTRLLPSQMPGIARALRAFMEHPGTPEWRFACLFMLLMITGARRREISHNLFSRIDWDGGRLAVPYAKRKEKDRTIILDPSALKLLAELKRLSPPGNPYIIAGGKRPGHAMDNVDTHMRKLLAIAGIPAGRKLGVVMHDLRRTFASAVSSTAGGSLKNLGDMLGHTKAETTNGYAWLFDDHAQALAKNTTQTLLAWMDQPEQSIGNRPY